MIGRPVLFLLPVLLLLMGPIPLQAQQVEKALALLNKEHPAEKIYIQYDKTYYRAGETVLFKAYLYCNGRPSVLSQNFYLQMADHNGMILADQRYPVMGAAVSGAIQLPDTLEQGVYYIRAMTPHMMNNDPAFLYYEPLYVSNPASKKKSTGISNDNNTLRFFPESGEMVEGLLTVVAFRASDAAGYPIELNGVIKTDDSVVITTFKTLHDGIGRFQLKPLPAKKYVAEFTINGKKSTVPLPETKSSGINLRIEDEKGGKAFTLSRSKKNANDFAALRLVAQSGNKLVYDEEITFDNFFMLKGHLVTDSIPSGILHFTVFSSNGQPLAERITFVDNREYESGGSVQITKRGTGKREENIFELTFPDDFQRSLSVSVAAAERADFSGRNDIVSSLLLTTDLRGEIFNPTWYFHKGGDTLVQKALDNLMLTHGWSRFEWKKILSAESSPVMNDDHYLFNITGTVYEENGDKTIQGGNIEVLLLMSDSSMLSYAAPVDQSGKFTLDSLLFRGTAKAFYTYKDQRKKEKKVKIKTSDNLLSFSSDQLPLALIGPATLHAEHELQKMIGNDENIVISNKDPALRTLENVTLTTRPKRPTDVVNEKYASAIFRSNGRVVVDNITYPPNDRAMNGLDFVRNRITTVDIQRGTFVNKKNFSLENHKDRTGPLTGEMRFWEVGLFLNEVPTTLEHLKSLRADQIAMVKFYEAGFVGAGASYPGGAIAVYLNEKPSLKIPQTEGAPITELTHNGYTLVKEFYSPDYATEAIPSSSPDNRTTLYWNPELFTGNGSNTVQLKFYNNDSGKKYRIIVEGFDSNGKLVHIEKESGN